jgi:hypothetical protein
MFTKDDFIPKFIGQNIGLFINKIIIKFILSFFIILFKKPSLTQFYQLMCLDSLHFLYEIIEIIWLINYNIYLTIRIIIFELIFFIKQDLELISILLDDLYFEIMNIYYIGLYAKIFYNIFY